jgi:hypothetical protein
MNSKKKALCSTMKFLNDTVTIVVAANKEPAQARSTSPSRNEAPPIGC